MNCSPHYHLYPVYKEGGHSQYQTYWLEGVIYFSIHTQHTRFDTYHQTSSLIDLSLCHSSIYMDIACEVLSDRLGSDHHPITITANTSNYPVPERVPKWNFKKAK